MTGRLRTPALALTAVLVLCGADGPPGRGLDIYFVDVMGGAATLVVTPERESVLIDSGWAGFEDRDPERIVHVLKDVAGLDHLDHLVTTHWHADHFGGVEGLTKRVRIDHFWDRGLPDPDAPGGDKAAFPDGPAADDPLGIAYRKASQGKRKALRPGDVLPLKGGVVARVLAAGGKVHEADAAKRVPNRLCEDAPADLPTDPSDNARSLVLHFRHGMFQFLDCGDLTWNVEKQLVCPYDRVGLVDVFQVTHHGQDISNHPTLLATIRPTVAIMDNGPTKGGMPATVKRLKAIPSLQALYQLHKNAATGPEDNTDPALIANSDPDGGRFIRVAVAADGARYTVRIGEHGAERSFETR